MLIPPFVINPVENRSLRGKCFVFWRFSLFFLWITFLSSSVHEAMSASFLSFCFCLHHIHLYTRFYPSGEQ